MNAVGNIRWGVLGATSYMTGLFVPAIRAAAGCRLAAVASRPASVERAVELAEREGAEAFPDYSALLASPDIDSVYLPLPNSEHTDWAVAALEAGKHVLVEKPIATRVVDVRQIRATAERTGRFVMEAFMYRFHPQFRRVAELAASGEIGDLRLVRASFAYPIASGSGNIRLEPKLGGGATWDVGCYAVDAPVAFFGRLPVRVLASFHTRPGEAVETTATAVMHFGDGRSAVIDYSIDYGPRASYELQGEKGSITVMNAWAFGDEPGRILVRTLDGTREEATPAEDHYRLEIEAFVAAIIGGGSPPLRLAESERTVLTCMSLQESAARGAFVTPGEGS